jgi:2-dehydro-3-deoxy-D-arabinonate dehydratase
MKIGKFREAGREEWAGIVLDDWVFPVRESGRPLSLTALLERSENEIRRRCEEALRGPSLRASDVLDLPPIDAQEVWGAGVTYLRSKQAREEESEQAASFYDQVYAADRPELFFKATPHRVPLDRARARAGPGAPFRSLAGRVHPGQ